MSTTGISPVGLPSHGRAGTALRLAGKMPVPRCAHAARRIMIVYLPPRGRSRISYVVRPGIFGVQVRPARAVLVCVLHVRVAAGRAGGMVPRALCHRAPRAVLEGDLVGLSAAGVAPFITTSSPRGDDLICMVSPDFQISRARSGAGHHALRADRLPGARPVEDGYAAGRFRLRRRVGALRGARRFGDSHADPAEDRTPDRQGADGTLSKAYVSATSPDLLRPAVAGRDGGEHDKEAAGLCRQRPFLLVPVPRSDAEICHPQYTHPLCADRIKKTGCLGVFYRAFLTPFFFLFPCFPYCGICP